MIDKKTILYVLLGVSVFALWEAWQKDYGVSSNQNSATSAISSTQKKEVSLRSEADEASEARIKTSAIKSSPEERLVKVRTDVLDVAIDLDGGNIVRADLLKYPELFKKEKPIRLLSDDFDNYYVAYSGLGKDHGGDNSEDLARYTANKKEYILEPSQDLIKVTLFRKGVDGVAIHKIFSFAKNKYDIALEYDIENKSNKTWSGQFYAEVKRKNFGQEKGMFKVNTYTGGAISSAEIPYEKISFANIDDAIKNKKEFIRENQGGWVAMQQRYFLSAWIPSQDKNYRYFNRVDNGVYSIGLSEKITVAPGKKETRSSVLYIGPEITDNFAHLAKGLDRTVDYGWLWVIAIGFFWVLKNIYRFVGNWGVAIILVTFLIKLLFYKLSESSGRSMVRMRELMPKIQALKERYSDDKQKLHQATMELYKREKVNPLNLGGCLPMLIQIPFFIALYYVLVGAVELRHAPFMFWIKDLSAADPYYVLPILMGLSMLLQQRLTPTSADPAQAKMMMIMPVVFTVFFINFPSGLVLYWIVNNVLSIFTAVVY
jgi:YidC/Oxa1 family membrane protein insertase